MSCGTKLQISSTSAGNWISLVMEIEVEPLAGALGVVSTMKINCRCERKTWNNGCLDEQPGLSCDAPLVHHFQGGFSKPSFFSTSSNRVFSFATPRGGLPQRHQVLRSAGRWD